MKRFKGIKGTIILGILIALILGYYYHLSNREIVVDEAAESITPAKEIMLYDYSINYPPTPKEVVKAYLYITKILHNDSLNDEEIEGVASKLAELFDDELVANKSREDYYMDMKSEIISFKNSKYSIVNYYASQSTEVVYFSDDGYDFAKLYGTYNIHTTEGTKVLVDVFILRKDPNGRWKIYGFKPYVGEDSAQVAKTGINP